MALLRWIVLASLLLVALPQPTLAKDLEETGPDAVQVVVRGKRTLADALEVGFHPAWADKEALRPAVLVLDVTSTMRSARRRIDRALMGIHNRGAKAASWHVAALGSKPRKTDGSLREAALELEEVLAKDTRATSTIAALTKTLKGVRGKGAVVVYVADAHFEDDCDLEKFIGTLRKKEITFTTIGPEAAFGRGWNDGMKDFIEDLDDVRGFTDYREGVGRSPFGSKKHKEPWFGGECSHPTRPWIWSWRFWETQFTPTDFDLMEPGEVFVERDTEIELPEGIELPKGLELPEGFGTAGSGWRERRVTENHALLERIASECTEALGETLRSAIAADRDRFEAEKAAHERKEKERKAAKERGEEPPAPAVPQDDIPDEPLVTEDGVTTIVIRDVPLPSSFGPYGLMRAAGMSGGRYVLYSFASGGQKTVEYDYARCNLFAPDLRSRKQIRKDILDHPHAAAVLETWNDLAAVGGALVDINPPLDARAKPQRIDKFSGGTFISFIWDHKSEYDAFRKIVKLVLPVLEKIQTRLDEVLAEPGNASTPAARRHEADALLLQHAIQKTRFELEEGLAALPPLTKKDWKKDKRPGLIGRDWIQPGREPHMIILDAEQEPADLDAGVRLFLQRRSLLRRLRGTPWGEQIALNGVEVSRPDWWEKIDHATFRDDRKRSRSKDKDKEKKPSTPSRGSSGGGGGPTTGGK